MLPNCAGIVAVFGRVLVSPTRQTTTNNGRTSFFMLGVFKSRRATSQRRYSLANGSTQGFSKTSFVRRDEGPLPSRAKDLCSPRGPRVLSIRTDVLFFSHGRAE